MLKTMVLLVGGPIIKSGDRKPADLGDQAVRLALLQVEAHFRPNHTYYTVYTNIITWPKNGHMLPTGQRYSLQVVKQVLHGIADVRQMLVLKYFITYQARALRALGLLLADGTPTVGGGKTF